MLGLGLGPVLGHECVGSGDRGEGPNGAYITWPPPPSMTLTSDALHHVSAMHRHRAELRRKTGPMRAAGRLLWI